MTLAATDFITEMQLWNAIVQHFGQPLPLSAGQVILAEGEPPSPPFAAFTLVVKPDISLSLALTEFPFARLTGVDLSLPEVLDLPNTLADGLLLGALDSLRVVMPSGLATLVEVPDAPGSADAHPLWLSADVDMGAGALARCRIGGQRQDFVRLLSLLQPGTTGRPAPLPRALLQDMSIAVAVSVGTADLPLSAVVSLEPGDVVMATMVLDQRSFLVGPRDVVIRRATGIDSQDAAAPGWSVKEIRMTGERPDTEAAALSLDDVPLSLRFVTEDQRITLSDLQGLAPGALLPFDLAQLAAGVPVRIQANGVTIGEGHLVQIDESFAVRIARMAPKGP